jgi:hypothetical protein
LNIKYLAREFTCGISIYFDTPSLCRSSINRRFFSVSALLKGGISGEVESWPESPSAWRGDMSKEPGKRTSGFTTEGILEEREEEVKRPLDLSMRVN